MKAMAIVNPAARKGRCGRAWPGLERRLRDVVDALEIRTTTARGDGTPLARAAVEEGYDCIVPVGGDGTVSEVVNGMVAEDRPINPRALMCPVPAGTANEVARALGLLYEPAAPFRAIAAGDEARLDVAKTICAGLGGGTRTYYAALLVSYGAAAEISYRTSNSRILKRLGGQFSYYVVSLIVTLTFQPATVRLTVDGEAQDTPTYTGLISNMENGAGGMKLAPGASYDDGALDLVLFRDIKRKDILLQPPSWLFEGRHVDHPKVDLIRGRAFKVEGPSEFMVDADGETIGRLPMQVETLPGLLRARINPDWPGDWRAKAPR